MECDVHPVRGKRKIFIRVKREVKGGSLSNYQRGGGRGRKKGGAQAAPAKHGSGELDKKN